MIDVGILETLESMAVRVDSLHPYEGNPRRGNLEVIKESLRENGQYRPIVVNRRDRVVLAGNHTLEAAKALGWDEIAVAWVDVDDEAARRIVAVDNRSNDLATYDEEALVALLSELPDLAGTGYNASDLEALLPPAERIGMTSLDAPAPVTKGDPISQRGDVWQLGDSTLLVGDATDTDAVLAAMGEARADCVWTDPPYGVSYVGGTSDALSIQGDDPQGLPELLKGAFATLVAAARPGAPVYVAYAESQSIAFHQALVGAGMLVRQHLVWVKNTLVLGHADYQYRHEPIWQAETPTEQPDEPLTHEQVAYGFLPGGTGRLGRGGPHWYGDNTATTVFEVPKPPRNADHPTMKPVDLIRPMIANSCPPGGLVLDLFGGSGSTLIAAWHERRRAFLVEIDERYADAICRRYQSHTGVQPIRNGQPVDFDAQREDE